MSTRDFIVQVLAPMISGSIAGLMIALGSFSILIGIHDYGNTEDSKVVWSCAYMGNHQCGPDMPRVQIDLNKLLEW